MATPSVTVIAAPPISDPVVDAITNGYKWVLNADHTVDWSISSGKAGEAWATPVTLQQNVAQILDNYASYANIKFNYVGTFADPGAAAAAGSEINLYPTADASTFSSDKVAAKAYFPSAANNLIYPGAAGDVVVNANNGVDAIGGYYPGGNGTFVLIHEIGHSLGLKHPHDDGGTDHPTFALVDMSGLDHTWATAMSYDDVYDASNLYKPATPMALDVLGLQALYGPNMSTNAGDSTYQLFAYGYYSTIWDAAGHDLVSAASSNQGWAIQLPDDQPSLSVSTRVGLASPIFDATLAAPRSLYWLMGDIEDAAGSGFSDRIEGSAAANRLSGLAGDDLVAGLGGADTLDGGAGADTVNGGLGDDSIVDTAGSNYLRGDEGADTIVGGAGFDDINGNMGDDRASGGDGDDWVLGGKDNDILNGDAGADLIYGNLGNDTLDGGVGADTIRGGQNNDMVQGGDGDDWLSGDRDNDTLTGGLGADIFHTFGDAGLDRVLDFSQFQGDRVLLDPGTTYTLSQSGADTLISMTGGGQMVLVGVALSSLNGGWIFGA